MFCTQAAGEAFPTTSEDLQGFWDMVMLQVDQIDNLFKDIKDLKENNWIEVSWCFIYEKIEFKLIFVLYCLFHLFL